MINSDTFAEAAATLHYGTVSALQLVPGKPPRVRVRLPAHDDSQTWWLAILQPKTHTDKVFWMPDIGEQVAVLLDVVGEQGVVLGAIYSDVDGAPVSSKDKFHIRFADDTVIEYDRAAHVLTADVKGTAVITAEETTINGPVTINGKLTVNDDVAVSGNLGAGGSITDSDGNNGA